MQGVPDGVDGFARLLGVTEWRAYWVLLGGLDGMLEIFDPILRGPPGGVFLRESVLSLALARSLDRLFSAIRRAMGRMWVNPWITDDRTMPCAKVGGLLANPALDVRGQPDLLVTRGGRNLACMETKMDATGGSDGMAGWSGEPPWDGGCRGPQVFPPMYYFDCPMWLLSPTRWAVFLQNAENTGVLCLPAGLAIGERERDGWGPDAAGRLEGADLETFCQLQLICHLAEGRAPRVPLRPAGLGRGEPQGAGAGVAAVVGQAAAPQAAAARPAAEVAGGAALAAAGAGVAAEPPRFQVGVTATGVPVYQEVGLPDEADEEAYAPVIARVLAEDRARMRRLEEYVPESDGDEEEEEAVMADADQGPLADTEATEGEGGQEAEAAGSELVEGAGLEAAPAHAHPEPRERRDPTPTTSSAGTGSGSGGTAVQADPWALVEEQAASLAPAVPEDPLKLGDGRDSDSGSGDEAACAELGRA
jgi:hypothetical protein